MEEYLPMHVLVISADGIKDVNLLSKMDVYAVASITGLPEMKIKVTAVDKDSGVNPKWYQHMEFLLKEDYLTKADYHCLFFQIMAESLLRNNKELGTVTIPLHELYQGNSTKEEKVVEYQVQTPSGRDKGTLRFSYSFGDKFTIPLAAAETKGKSQLQQGHENPAVATTSTCASYPLPLPERYPNSQHLRAYLSAMAAPYPLAGAAYPGIGYPPSQTPQQQYPLPLPTPMVYTANYPQPSGYGCQPAPLPPPPPPVPALGYAAAHPPAQQSKKNKKKTKMGSTAGLGLGLGAGLLGGMLLGEVTSEVGDAVSSYADGYEDVVEDIVGGFDF